MEDYDLYVCISSVSATHRRPGMEELSVEKKSDSGHELTHASNKYLVRVYFVCTVISAKQR